MENDIKLKFQVYANQRSCKIKIKFLSDEAIIAWGSRILPDGTIVGEITFPGTINYKTKNEPFNLSLRGKLNILKNKVNFDYIKMNNHQVSAEDLKFYKNIFENSFFEKNLFINFNKENIKEFILEIS